MAKILNIEKQEQKINAKGSTMRASLERSDYSIIHRNNNVKHSLEKSKKGIYVVK